MTGQELVEHSGGVFLRSGEDLVMDTFDGVLGVGIDVVGVLLVDDLLILIVALQIVGAQRQRVVHGGLGLVGVVAEDVLDGDQIYELLRQGHVEAGSDVVHAVELGLLTGEGDFEVVLAVLLIGLEAHVGPQLVVGTFGRALIVFLGTLDGAGLGVGQL